MDSKTALVLAILTTVLYLGFWIGGYVGEYFVSRDTTALLERAQVASNPLDMRDYLLGVKKGMEDHDMTHGHAALIFKKPDNDMELIFRALESSINRADAIKDLEITSTEYQVALDDIRGQIRELDLKTESYYWRHGIGLFFIIMMLFFLIPVGNFWYIALGNL